MGAVVVMERAEGVVVVESEVAMAVVEPGMTASQALALSSLRLLEWP
jgi:hypothetical protein